MKVVLLTRNFEHHFPTRKVRGAPPAPTSKSKEAAVFIKISQTVELAVYIL